MRINPKGEMKAVAQGLINNVDQDVVHHVKLALDSVMLMFVQQDLQQSSDKKKRNRMCWYRVTAHSAE